MGKTDRRASERDELMNETIMDAHVCNLVAQIESERGLRKIAEEKLRTAEEKRVKDVAAERRACVSELTDMRDNLRTETAADSIRRSILSRAIGKIRGL